MNKFLRTALAIAIAIPALWAAQEAQANFGGSAGFSGIAGATCSSCHLPPHPTQDDAAVTLEGLPAQWEVGKSYPLTIRISGGPTPLPTPAPQGGFDIATDSGTLTGDPEAPGLFVQPRPGEVTYSAAGTQMREWQVIWTAPNLDRKPAPAQFWLAIVAANGNHVIAANRSDGGETLDSTASLRQSIAPASSALDAWRALPLQPPTATATASEAGWTIQGHHADANATALLFRLDSGPWETRDTGPSWRISIPDAGPHRLDYRSDGDGRKSPVQTLTLGEPGELQSPTALPRPTPPSFPLVLGALAIALSLAHRSRT